MRRINNKNKKIKKENKINKFLIQVTLYGIMACLCYGISEKLANDFIYLLEKIIEKGAESVKQVFFAIMLFIVCYVLLKGKFSRKQKED